MTDVTASHGRPFGFVAFKKKSCIIDDILFNFSFCAGRENLECLICDQIFPNEPTRLEHNEQHANKKLLKCFQCDYTAAHEVRLTSHYLESHVDTNNLEIIYSYPYRLNSSVTETVKQNSLAKQIYIDYYCSRCQNSIPYIIFKEIGHICE